MSMNAGNFGTVTVPLRRHGWRRWHRFVCKLVGHDPWYSATAKNGLGLIVAYKMGCWRCGELIESFHPEVFEPRSVPIPSRSTWNN